MPYIPYIPYPYIPYIPYPYILKILKILPYIPKMGLYKKYYVQVLMNYNLLMYIRELVLL